MAHSVISQGKQKNIATRKAKQRTPVRQSMSAPLSRSSRTTLRCPHLLATCRALTWFCTIRDTLFAFKTPIDGEENVTLILGGLYSL